MRRCWRGSHWPASGGPIPCCGWYLSLDDGHYTHSQHSGARRGARLRRPFAQHAYD
jgi:hypothetical protein